MARHAVCRVEDVPVGEKKPFKIEGTKILIHHLDDGLYATQGGCTHVWVPLAHGQSDNGCITCPAHRARFDVKTGRVIQWANWPPGIGAIEGLRPPKPLATYPVVVEDGTVFVELG